MKKPILILIILIVGLSSFSQTPLILSETNSRLLKNSQNKKTTATGFLVFGTVAVVAGISIFNESSNLDAAFTGIGLAIFGGGLVVTSIPLYYSAFKNKKKAMSVAVLQQNSNMQWKPNNISGMQTAISLKVNLGK